MHKKYDYIILGAGIFGMYSSLRLLQRGLRVCVLEYDETPFERASWINQARVHNGYHYPRSFSTAIKSRSYFDRFCKDFSFAINKSFLKIYAISSCFSMVSSKQFEKFCEAADLPCYEVSPKKWFKDGTVEAAFETLEYAFDAPLIKKYFQEQISQYPNYEGIFKARIKEIENTGKTYILRDENQNSYEAPNLFNSTYQGINQILAMAGYEMFKIKYEICEMILCDVNQNIQGTGLTVMDGPFFSLMPFGCSETYSLTAVTFTPHITCYTKLPEFPCQKRNPECTPTRFYNCNLCPARPETAWPFMSQLARKYLKESIGFSYKSSLFAIKPILLTSEIDDSRPTLIKQFSQNPGFYSVLSGKVNTIYDLDEVLS